MPSVRKADWLLLAALLTAAVLISLLAILAAPPRRQGGLPRQRSTFVNTRDGTKAAYLSLERLGFFVDRLRRPIDDDTLAGVRAVAVLEPVTPLTHHESRRLLAWVRGGGQLLLAPGGRHDGHGAYGADAARLIDWFAWTEAPTGVFDTDEKDGPVKFVRVSGDAAAGLLSGVAELTVAGDGRFDEEVVDADGPLADCPLTPLWGDEDGLVAVRLACGEGEIIALADVHALCNRGLREADNALWLANLARRLAGHAESDLLLFDEYHAGFPYQEPSWTAIARLMLAEGWGPSVGQAAFVAVLWLIAGGVRFGQPRGGARSRRRRHGEFLVAAGRLLYAARATDLAAETLRRHYHDRLCRAVGVPNTAPETALRDALAARDHAWWLDGLSSESARRINVHRLLAACRRLEQELEQLERVK